MLSPGRNLLTEHRSNVEVGGLLGFGGRGEVYGVTTGEGSRALKWYYPRNATARQKEDIRWLISRRLDDRFFLWPKAIVEDPQGEHDGFGYLMDVRPAGFRDLAALYRREVRVSSRTLTAVALNTADAYSSLHESELAFRAVDWNGLFLDPDTGSVLISDVDDIVAEGGAAGFVGAADLMAPELVRGDAGAAPGRQSDLHSLAVLIFLILLDHHPLEGAAALRTRRRDEAAKRTLFGLEPVFVFDPRNASNAPLPGDQDTVIANWTSLPPDLRELFTRSFTAGLRDPAGRVRESEWCEVLSAMHDAVVECASCGRENFPALTLSTAPVCWKCAKTLVLPPRLEITAGHGSGIGTDSGTGRVVRSVRLSRGALVYQHHLDREPGRRDLRAVVGKLTQHPHQPGKIGLTNCGTTAWTAHPAGGETQQVAPGRSAALRPGLVIEFGDGAEAVYRAP